MEARERAKLIDRAESLVVDADLTLSEATHDSTEERIARGVYELSELVKDILLALEGGEA